MVTGRKFPKRERLDSRKQIEMLFGGGGSLSMAAFPLRVVYIIKERARADVPAQLLVSVSKRHFKHAVDRNRVKRQIREAYRLHKQLLGNCISDDQELLIAFIWLSDSHCPSNEVEKRMISLLQRIAKK
jgi:ribonuclease P protein component